MGFCVPKRARRLKFDAGSDYEGLEIECLGMTVDEWLHDHRDVAELFVEKVISWNWETEDGTPIHPAPLPEPRKAGEAESDYAERLAALGFPEGHADIGSIDRQDLRNVAGWWVHEVTDLRPFALLGTSARGKQNGQVEAKIPMTPIAPG